MYILYLFVAGYKVCFLILTIVNSVGMSRYVSILFRVPTSIVKHMPGVNVLDMLHFGSVSVSFYTTATTILHCQPWCMQEFFFSSSYGQCLLFLLFFKIGAILRVLMRYHTVFLFPLTWWKEHVGWMHAYYI